MRNINFIEKRKLFITISVALAVITFLAALILKPDLDIQFRGGTIITYIYDGEINESEFASEAQNVLNIPVNATTGTDFSTGRDNISLSLSSNEGLTADKQFELTNTLSANYADNNLELLESSDVSPSAGREFFLKCLVAVIFSSILITVYIAVRFKRTGGWLAGVCAVAALIHDCIIVFGAFVFLGIDINANFMAVILTILGYSINSTIVVYDRIRENEAYYRDKKSRAEIINQSLNQSLTRSINTTLTTVTAMLVVTIVAMIYGVNSIVSFSLPMVVGLLAGMYSSLCFTCSLWYTISPNKKKGKKAEA